MTIVIVGGVVIAALLAICSGIWVAIALVHTLGRPSSEKRASSD